MTNPLACNLSTPEFQKRKSEVISVLKRQVKDKKEIGNGFSYMFDYSSNQLNTLAEFIKYEKQCCSFFEFGLKVRETSIELEITGPEGVKDFLSDELGF